MTIQPSVLLWTIICFCLLMLILDRLLFRPMLAFMDKRRCRIARAKETIAERNRALAEAEEKAAAYREECSKQAAEQRAAVLESARARADEAVSAAQKKSEQILRQYEAECSAEIKEMEIGLMRRADKLVDAFAHRLVS